MTQVQKLFPQNPHQEENATNNRREVNDPKMIGGIVGGLLVFGLLILGAMLMRRKRRDAKYHSNEQVIGTADQLPGSMATELAPDTKKSELQCPSDPSVARHRGSIQSPRTELAAQEGQMSHISPVGTSNMIPPISELAAPKETGGREAGHPNIAFKTNDSGERSSITDRITI